MTEFDRLLREAVNAVSAGTTADEIMAWQEKLTRAAEAEMGSSERSERRVREAMEDVYNKLVGPQPRILKRHPGLSAYTITQLSPQLRAELDKRIMFNYELIKLNRREAIEQTKRRFSGWASSIPPGGSKSVDKKEARENIRESLSGLPFEERRVLIDQGAKLEAAVSDIVAEGGGAIAAIWKSHAGQINYDFRPEHKARATKSAKLPYVVRGNWALQNGLMRLANSQYTDQITKPAEEPFCRCWYEYIYTLRDLYEIAPSMVTKKGLDMLNKRR